MTIQNSVMALAIFFALEGLVIAGSLKGMVKLTLKDGTLVSPRDAVVYLTGVVESAPKKSLVVSQADQKFSSRTVPITKGQSIIYKNSDKITHNVFSVSGPRAFDLGHASPGESSSVYFGKLGVVSVYCNIHPQMVSTVIVLPNRKFTKPGADGHYQINGIKPGQYTTYAWHNLAKPLQNKVTIFKGRPTVFDWNLMSSREQVPHLNKKGKPYKKRSYR